ncbi:cullin-1, putative [Plasmodium chabaudi chabaudi]|uniref:Cullin-1, putative n=1 Tax=Plasmodium chabaudi chabaudi TaxID=31271 RepID=A0A1D3S3H3_PLACU|nr:cullin-1, putative [Plasmodium chabaudi chabaudi]
MDISSVNFESGWKIIKEEAIDKIEKYLDENVVEINNNLFNAAEYTRLYTVVYNMCAKKTPFCYSKEVYRKYGESLSTYAVNKIKPHLKEADNLKKTKALIDAWYKYSFYTNWMNKFLHYLDRYYVEYNSSLCLKAYTKNIFKLTLFDETRECIKSIIYNIYDSMRTSDDKDNEKLFRDIVFLYNELDKESAEKMYESDIEKKILENVETYYNKEGNNWIQNLSFHDYIILIENSIEKEYEKNKSLEVNNDTCEKVTNIIVRILIYDKLNLLLDNKENIYNLLKDNNLNSLRRTYILFSYFSEAIDGLKKIIGEYIKAEGNKLKEKYISLSMSINNNIDTPTYESNKNSNIADQKNEYILCEYIHDLIKLHDYYHNMFNFSFVNISNNEIDANFKECLKDYFESFVEHEDEYFSTVKLLVLYADNILTIKNNKEDMQLPDVKNDEDGDYVKHEMKTIINTDELKNDYNKIGNKEGYIGSLNDIRQIRKENDDADSTCDTNIIETDYLIKKMSDIVSIFNYISNKESFFEYYRIYLANRLINNMYISINVEKKFIENLYFLCGSQYTSKLGGMIQNIINNKILNEKFYNYINRNNSNGEIILPNLTNFDENYENNFFSVKILNKGYWPALEKTSMKLSENFNKYILSYTEYYKAENKNKKLEWIYELSEVVFKYFINNRPYYLYCNLISAEIFLLFNKYKYINYDIIKEELQIDLKTFKDNMHSSLYYHKIIYSDDDSINWDTSNFYINENFSYTNQNVYIKKTTTLLSKEHEKTKDDKSMAIEAAIVRIMKTHKRLFYDQIFDHVKKVLSTFSPSNQAIEKKIDLLVEREYIQKEENSQVYVYIP